MIEAVEVAGGVWLFRNSDNGRNWGVSLGEAGALLIDPGVLPQEIDATRRFVAEKGRSVEAIVYTQSLDGDTAHADQWPDVTLITPVMQRSRGAISVSGPGWETVPLYSGAGARVVVYNAEGGILFCGEMLAGGDIPSLSDSSQRYIDDLDRIEELGPKLAVPRWGTPAEGKRSLRERIERERNYLYALRRHVATSLAAGATLERVLEVAGQIYEDYPYLEGHLRNMRYTWEELQDAEEFER